MVVFTANIAISSDLRENIKGNIVDVTSMIFVLSAVEPKMHKSTLLGLYDVLKEGGILIFRDYSINDKAQSRFKDSQKINDNWAVRQDGTFSYFFSENEVIELFQSARFELVEVKTVHREVNNVKENISLERKFIQGTFRKKCRGNIE